MGENDHVTENPNKQGHQRPWVRFEREYAGVTVHIDWYQNDRGDHVLGVEDEERGVVFDMIETDASSAAASVELLDHSIGLAVASTDPRGDHRPRLRIRQHSPR